MKIEIRILKALYFQAVSYDLTALGFIVRTYITWFPVVIFPHGCIAVCVQAFPTTDQRRRSDVYKALP